MSNKHVLFYLFLPHICLAVLYFFMIFTFSYKSAISLNKSLCNLFWSSGITAQCSPIFILNNLKPLQSLAKSQRLPSHSWFEDIVNEIWNNSQLLIIELDNIPMHNWLIENSVRSFFKCFVYLNPEINIVQSVEEIGTINLILVQRNRMSMYVCM